MRKFKRTEFVVGKRTDIGDAIVNKGNIVQIIPIEFFDNLGSDYRDFAKDLDIQDDLAVLVSFYTKEDYNKQFIDGSINPIAELPVHAFSLPDMFKDLKIRSKTITFVDKD